MDPARILIPVRFDDLDPNGHVRGAAYVAYADHARWEWVRGAGAVEGLRAAGLGPVNLETTVRFRRELRGGETLAITSVPRWNGGGRTTGIRQELRRADGTLVAEVESVSGVLDLATRRLVPDPVDRWRAAAADPKAIGL